MSAGNMLLFFFLKKEKKGQSDIAHGSLSFSLRGPWTNCHSKLTKWGKKEEVRTS
jgi:hypothetical protein